MESIVICTTQPIACSAGIDTKINVYDLTDLTQRLKVSIGEFGGFSKVFWSTGSDSRLNLVAASTLGDIYTIDPRSGLVIKKIRGHDGSSINDIKEFKI